MKARAGNGAQAVTSVHGETLLVAESFCMSSKFKTHLPQVALVVCGIMLAGTALLYRENTRISYVTTTSIFDSESDASQSDVEKMAQQQGAVEGPLAGKAPLGTSTTPATSISTSNEVVPAIAGNLDNAGDVEHKSATESVVAEVDKVVIPVYTEGTVLSAMEAYRDADRAFSFDGTLYPGLGFFVETLQGIAQGDGKYWMLYVNDESSDLGASRTVVAPGDVVEWRLEASTF